MRFYIIKADDYFWFELKDEYGKVIMRSFDYNTYTECRVGLDILKKTVPNAEIVEI